MALSYSENFDALIALTTHLGATPFKSRRAPSLARDLGLDLSDVKTVLQGFPGIFRKSRRTDETDEPYYTLHLRYARRNTEEEAPGEDQNEPLKPPELASLLDVILKMVAHEQDANRLLTEQQYHTQQFTTELRQKTRTVLATIAVSLLASLIAAGASLYKANAGASACTTTPVSNQQSAPAAPR